MAPQSSVLAWRIPGMGERGGLLSMGSHRVGHDWSDSAAAAAAAVHFLGIKQETVFKSRMWKVLICYNNFELLEILITRKISYKDILLSLGQNWIRNDTRDFTHPGNCKYCYNEHWSTCILSIYGFLQIHAQEWGCWIIWHLCF